jgi:beta-lactam-binding protein with PASTA domain
MRPSEFNDLVLEQKHNGQMIQPGSRLDNGSTIDLVVGKNIAGGETTIPNLTTLSLTAARDTLRSRSLTVGSIIYDPAVRTSEDTLSAVIWKQMPLPDSTAHAMRGISVDVWLKPKAETTNPEIQ